jgi:hypothetical protein
VREPTSAVEGAAGDAVEEVGRGSINEVVAWAQI